VPAGLRTRLARAEPQIRPRRVTPIHFRAQSEGPQRVTEVPLARGALSVCPLGAPQGGKCWHSFLYPKSKNTKGTRAKGHLCHSLRSSEGASALAARPRLITSTSGAGAYTRQTLLPASLALLQGCPVQRTSSAFETGLDSYSGRPPYAARTTQTRIARFRCAGSGRRLPSKEVKSARPPSAQGPHLKTKHVEQMPHKPTQGQPPSTTENVDVVWSWVVWT